MLSSNQKKLIRSLTMKKFRTELGLFVVEGHKMVLELLNAPSGSIPFGIEWIGATGDWLAEFGGSIPGGTEHSELTDKELSQVSSQKEPNRVIALVKQADYSPDMARLADSLVLGLDSIQDPGRARITQQFVEDLFILCSQFHVSGSADLSANR